MNNFTKHIIDCLPKIIHDNEKENIFFTGNDASNGCKC